MHLQQDVFTASDASPVQKPAVGWIYNTLIIAVCDNILFQSCSNLISNLDDCLSRGSKQRTRGKMCLLDGLLYLEKFPLCFFWTDLNHYRHAGWLANEKSRTPKWNKSSVISWKYLFKSVPLCELSQFSLSFFFYSTGFVRRRTQPSFQFSLWLAVRADIIISQVFFSLTNFSHCSAEGQVLVSLPPSGHRALWGHGSVSPRCGARRASRCPFNLPTAGSLVIMGLQ